MAAAQTIVDSFRHEQLAIDRQQRAHENHFDALEQRIQSLGNDRLLALVDGKYVAKVHGGLVTSRDRSLDPQTEAFIQDTARATAVQRVFDAATKQDIDRATALIRNFAANDASKVALFATDINEKCTQAVLSSDPAAPIVVDLFSQIGLTARQRDEKAQAEVTETLRRLEAQRKEQVRDVRAAEQQSGRGAQAVAGIVVATALASGGAVATASPASAASSTVISVTQEKTPNQQDPIGDVVVAVPSVPNEAPVIDFIPNASRETDPPLVQLPRASTDTSSEVRFVSDVSKQKIADVVIGSGSLQPSALPPQTIPTQIAPNQIVDTPTIPATVGPEQPVQGPDNSAPSIESPAPSDQPEIPPVVEAPPSPDVYRDQLKQDVVDIMTRFEAANNAKSIAVMRGDTSIDPNKIGKDTDLMPDGLLAANKVLLQDLQKVLDTDVHYIADGDQSWKQQVLDNDSKSFFVKQQDAINQIEATALAYEALGQQDQADQLRAEGVYYVTLDKFATDVNIRDEFLNPTPATSSEPTPETPPKPSAPEQTPGHQEDLKLRITDKLVLQHISKDQIAKLEDKLSILLAVQDQTGVPWEVVASLWYREHAFSSSNPSNGQGIFQLYSSGLYFKPGKTTDKEFMRQAILAANFIKHKADNVQEVPGKISLNMSDDFVKEIFCQYNGCPVLFRNQAEARGFQNHAEGSPYVMNYADASRTPGADNWSQYRSDGGNIGNAGTQLGAYLLYRGLENAKITKVVPKTPEKPHHPEKPPQSRDKLFHDNEHIVIPNAEKALKMGDKLVAQTKDAMKTGDIEGFIPLCPRKDPGHRCKDRCDHIAALIWGHEHSGYETARKHRIAMHDQGKLHNGQDKYDVPIGAYVFWGTKGDGHAAIYAGNGMIYSTSIYDNAYDFSGGIYLAKASDITKLWGLKYTGWAYDKHLS